MSTPQEKLEVVSLEGQLTELLERYQAELRQELLRKGMVHNSTYENYLRRATLIGELLEALEDGEELVT